jgi:2-dehydro-3-deoxy-D-arabinonate dehydratase
VFLTRHEAGPNRRWAVDGRLLPPSLGLGVLLELPGGELRRLLEDLAAGDVADAVGPPVAPIEDHHEVWAGGVTYQRSRRAREEESKEAGGTDFYARVYDATRPELFFKAPGWRVVGPGQPIRAHPDARWTVPEPELVLVCNHRLEIVGYCAGNDVSSRDIECANPLYLPQAKIYDGACALGPGIVLCDAAAVTCVAVKLAIERDGATIFSEETNTSAMKRTPEELVGYLGRALSWPQGVFLMTGTSIVPSDEYSLREGDRVTVTVGPLELTNIVAG